MKIIVAGAGVMGLSCAWRLAAAGASVELIDPREPGHGATLASLGALWPASPLARGPLQQLHRSSLWMFEKFASQLSAETALPVTFRRLGRMEILNSVKAQARARLEAEAANKEWPAFGAASPTMEVVDFPCGKKINSGVAPFTFGALLCRATAQVSINEFVAALVAACRGRGVVMHKAAITALLKTGSRVHGVQTTSGKIEADNVLVTAGAWTPQLGSELAACALVTPAKGQGLALPMPPSRPVTTILKSQKIYLIPWDNELLVGSTTEPDAGFDEKPTPDARETLLAGAAALVPELAGAPVLRHWAGLRPATEDDLPIMGEVPESSGLCVCAGHYKTGIGLSPRVSELIVDLIVNGKSSPELAAFAPGRDGLRGKPSRANP